MKPLVSIIVPVYNTEKYLCECIDSILKQTFEDFELILVNDGSTDNSLHICKHYSGRDKRIKIFNQSNQGVTATRKHGVEIAKGKYILFVDSDDTIPQDSIYTLVSATKKDLDIIIGSLNNDFKREGLIDAETYRKKCIEGSIFPGPVGKLFKRDLFNNYVFEIPREIIKGEDMLMNVRIAFNCNNNILLLQDVVYEYRRHDNSCVSKFRTNWAYEGLFYEQLFASIPSDKHEEYMPYLIKKAMEVWHDFFGYRYLVPKGYNKSKMYVLLLENFKKHSVDISPTDRFLFEKTNIFYRFIIINFKRINRIINYWL